MCGAFLLTVAIWTSWLFLVILLACQAYVASVNEMPVPQFLLHGIEAHLAASGVSVRFGRATFDPTGRVLLEKAQFRLDAFAEPVVTADAIYLRLDPWALLARRFEARQVRATGANLFVPAMLSATGRPEKVIEDLDAEFSIAARGDEFSVDYLSCRLGDVCVSASGQVNAGSVARNGVGSSSLPLTEFLSNNYVGLSKEFLRAEGQLGGFDHAVVSAVLTPSDTRGAIVSAELFADGLKLTDPVAADATRIRGSSRFPLLGGAPLMTSVVATAEELSVAGRLKASGARARLRGILRIDTLGFVPKELDFTAASLAWDGSAVQAPIVRLRPSGGHVGAEVQAVVLGRPLRAHADVDTAARAADVSFDASLSPGILEPISARMGVNLRHFADLTEPLDARGVARFGPGWAFKDVTGRVDTRRFTAYHVPFDEARASVYYDGGHLKVTNAVGVSGDDFVLGSYEQDFTTQDFRYLLKGRLRPLNISPWFGGDWWVGVFGGFGFPRQGPDANIDVRGRYSKVRRFAVFGYAVVPGPIVKGVPFDTLRSILYVDEHAADGIEIVVTQGTGSAQGSFKLSTEPTQGALTGLDIDGTSNIDPGPIGRLLPDEGAAAIAAFAFDRPPSATIHGHFDWPGAEAIAHKNLHTVVRSDTPLLIDGVAFDRASFTVDLLDDDIDVSNVEAGFAGGTVAASARVTGVDPERRLNFKASLTSGSLGLAAQAASGYVSTGKDKGSTAMDIFAKDKSGVRLDLNVSGTGLWGSLASFAGEGNFQIQGSGLGELSLLGSLSKAIRFTELRFTQARATFKIKDASLEFPDLSVLGANSEIRAKGTYSIDRRTLDFSANIYPFIEGKAPLQIFSAISAPFSALLRVRLGGSIDNPTWRLAYSPLNLLRVEDAKAGAPDKSIPPTPLANPTP
jgi:hypothetical protein